MKSRSRVKGKPASPSGMGERVALTDVIIHSGQKTVSRYVYPAGCNASCRMLHSRETKMSDRVYAHSACVLRGAWVAVFPRTSWSESRQEFTGDRRIDPFDLFEKSSPFVASTRRSWPEHRRGEAGVELGVARSEIPIA